MKVPERLVVSVLKYIYSKRLLSHLSYILTDFDELKAIKRFLWVAWRIVESNQELFKKTAVDEAMIFTSLLGLRKYTTYSIFTYRQQL
jgi:hypothetical protein